MGTERRLRAGLLRGQAVARKSPPSQQGSRVIPPPQLPPWGPPRSGRQVLTRPAPHHHHATSTSQRLPAGEDKGTAGDHILPQA